VVKWKSKKEKRTFWLSCNLFWPKKKTKKMKCSLAKTGSLVLTQKQQKIKTSDRNLWASFSSIPDK
jgi:hypothetical protein